MFKLYKSDILNITTSLKFIIKLYIIISNFYLKMFIVLIITLAMVIKDNFPALSYTNLGIINHINFKNNKKKIVYLLKFI